jgi:hypothetical protein
VQAESACVISHYVSESDDNLSLRASERQHVMKITSLSRPKNVHALMCNVNDSVPCNTVNTVRMEKNPLYCIILYERPC